MAQNHSKEEEFLRAYFSADDEMRDEMEDYAQLLLKREKDPYFGDE